MTSWDQIIFDALASPLGLLLKTDEPEKARQKLYAARRGIDGVKELQLRIVDHPEGNLAITKGPVTGPSDFGV